MWPAAAALYNFKHRQALLVLAMPVALQEGSTVLHMVCKSMMCAMSGQLSMAKAVLDHGADPEAVDEVSMSNLPVARGVEQCSYFVPLALLEVF